MSLPLRVEAARPNEPLGAVNTSALPSAICESACFVGDDFRVGAGAPGNLQEIIGVDVEEEERLLS